MLQRSTETMRESKWKLSDSESILGKHEKIDKYYIKYIFRNEKAFTHCKSFVSFGTLMKQREGKKDIFL